MRDPEPDDELGDPEVMFLPLAAAAGPGWHGYDPGVLARRIPDFVHQLLNRGQVGPTAMLELQATAENGAVQWVQLEAPPDRDEAFELLPDEVRVHAIVTGELLPVENGLRVEFHVFREEDEDDFATEKMGGVVPIDDPVGALMRLARRLARLLALPFHEPPAGLLTRNGAAFGHFLRGLDNAMLLSGDLEIALPDDREQLIRPFADALQLDPGFGLALRVANATTAMALHGARLDGDVVRSFLDRCYAAQPFDGDACVAVAEQLSYMGDDDRALAWLEHAIHLDPPPPKGLESLGILKARRGDADAARGLWERGLDVDGHPDFFSHLAQLSFAESRPAEAWELFVRGLRRLRERTLRAAEWDDAAGGAGVLLECLSVHVQRTTPPVAVVEALMGLRSLLSGDDRTCLGLCLFACGKRREARIELVAGLRGMLDTSLRDRAVRAMLQIDVAEFEARFARATERATRGRGIGQALGEFRLWLHLQPEFWPALYYSAIGMRRQGHRDRALDVLAAALEIAPDQPDVLYEMAELFARRQNCKRALELIEKALRQRPFEPRMQLARARYLCQLDRRGEARRLLERAIADGCDDPKVRRLARRLAR
ncbi:MAG: tetratricopeptide repeat protein [Planctomycetes bacterium]|nr:tetratricopeptide repeat protein [Planctomycetota bacterium]